MAHAIDKMNASNHRTTTFCSSINLAVLFMEFSTNKDTGLLTCRKKDLLSYDKVTGLIVEFLAALLQANLINSGMLIGPHPSVNCQAVWCSSTALRVDSAAF